MSYLLSYIISKQKKISKIAIWSKKTQSIQHTQSAGEDLDSVFVRCIAVPVAEASMSGRDANINGTNIMPWSGLFGQ